MAVHLPHFKHRHEAQAVHKRPAIKDQDCCHAAASLGGNKPRGV